MHHLIRVRIIEPTEESFTEPCDLGPGKTFQNLSVSSPAHIQLYGLLPDMGMSAACCDSHGAMTLVSRTLLSI